MTQADGIAQAADYADALISARRFRNLLTFVLLFLLLAQIVVFFLYRTWGSGAAPAATSPADLPPWFAFLQFATAVMLFGGMLAAALLCVTHLLILFVLLAGRLLGAARAVQAFVWSAFVFLLLFPWQALLYYPGLPGAETRIPGVLYTWTELTQHARFGLDSQLDAQASLLKWSRFVAFPLLALLLTLFVQSKSRRALRQALHPTP